MGRSAQIRDPAYLERLGLPAARTRDAGSLWERLAEPVLEDPSVAELHRPLGLALERGPLAERILRAAGRAPSQRRLREIYGLLCACVEEGEPYEA